MDGYRDWLLAQDGQVATLTLNRPHAQNNISHDTLDELRGITTYLAGQRDIWVVILEGRGAHFSTGIDLEVIAGKLRESAEAVRDYVRGEQECLDALAGLEKPTIAKLQGFCIGGGLLLAACCDFRVASTRTVFQLPEVRLGLPILWGTHRISRLVGESLAKEMILLCRRLRAQEALTYGLVNKVVPAETLDRSVASFAERFLQLPARTIAVTKRIINEIDAASARESQERELNSLAQILRSPDVLEALRSNMETRSPEFRGE